MMRRLAFFAALFAMSVVSVAQGQTFNVLHSFNDHSDGGNPCGRLIWSGSTLYGMTSWCGSNNNGGTIFQIGTDGSGFSLLHSFGNSSNGSDPYDGMNPQGGLTLVGSTLYGMTSRGGNNNLGTVFKIGTNGSDYGLLHGFIGPPDGQVPCGDLTAIGSTLYGMTQQGGNSAYSGTIFQVGIDGKNYGLLHSFNVGADMYPAGSLLLCGSTFYGTTQGYGGKGTVFKIGSDGSGFTVLYTQGAYPDGVNFCGGLALSGSTLYGMSTGGGSNNGGTIFKIGTDGSGYEVLHSFIGGSNDGFAPQSYSGLTILGSTLYGITQQGGSSNEGTLFSINTDGSDFGLLHSFVGGSGDGAYPISDLTLIGSTLYGTAFNGGGSNYGVIYSLTVPEPSTFALLGIGVASLLAFACWKRRRTA